MLLEVFATSTAMDSFQNVSLSDATSSYTSLSAADDTFVDLHQAALVSDKTKFFRSNDAANLGGPYDPFHTDSCLRLQTFKGISDLGAMTASNQDDCSCSILT